MENILYEESISQCLWGKYFSHVWLIIFDIFIFSIFFGAIYSHIKWNIGSIIIFAIPGIPILYIHILMILRLFVNIYRIKITSKSIIEGNWDFSVIREIPFGDIKYIAIDMKNRCVSIMDVKNRKVMVFSFKGQDEFHQVIYILKKTKLILKNDHDSRGNITLDKSVLELYKR